MPPSPVRKRWRNYVQSVDITVDYWSPTTLSELVYIVEQAEAQGKRLHAVGSGYSFEDLATSPNWMVDLAALDQILPRGGGGGLVDAGIHSRALTEPWRTRQLHEGPVKLVHVEAGIRLFDLAHALEAQITAVHPRGLALPTMGGTHGQRLAGAISTSTHGSDHGQPPFCDLVHAVHLVTTGGRQLWVEAASHPLTDDDALLRAAIGAPSDLQIIRDDDLLRSIVVSAGRFGVIYSFVLQVTPAFDLAEHTTLKPWRDVRAALATGVGRGPTDGSPFGSLGGLLVRDEPPFELGVTVPPGEYRHLTLIFNPHKPDSCWIRRRWPTGNHTPLNVAPTSEPMCQAGVANAVLAAASLGLKTYAGTIGATIPVYGAIKAAEITARSVHLDHLALDPHLTGGAALAAALDAIWASQMGNELAGLVDELTQMTLTRSLASATGPGRRGASWEIAGGTEDPAHVGDCFRANSIEIVFGLDTPAYLDFIDAVLGEARHHRQAGYISARFTRRSEALLSMHHVPYPLACSIEITSLRGLSGNDGWMRWIEHAALERGGRPHWGQQNHLTATQVERLYGDDLERWRSQLERVVGASPTFSNAYTLQRGLEPAWEQVLGHGRDIAIGGVGPGPLAAPPGGPTIASLGVPYVIGTDTPAPGNGGIWKHEGDHWRHIPGYGVRIAADPEGNWWIVNSRGEIWGPRGHMPGHARDIGIGADGSVYVIGADTPAPGNGSILRWTGSAWHAVGGYGTRIAVDPHGQWWIVNAAGEIWGPGGHKPSHARDIGVGADGSVWMIGTDEPVPGNGGVYHWTGSAWRRVSGYGIAIAVGPDGKPWVVRADGEIWRLVR